MSKESYEENLQILQDYIRLSKKPRLPETSNLSLIIEKFRHCLSSEDHEIRPRDKNNLPGGIVKLKEIPTIVLPDLHARPELITKVFEYVPEQQTENVLELLMQKKINLVSLGDIMHSEDRGSIKRWHLANKEYLKSWQKHRAMDEEMSYSLAAAILLMQTKICFTSNVHWIKGNHDNISKEEKNGDHSFYKFAQEGPMSSSWFDFYYGKNIKLNYRQLELNLPILAFTKNIVLSHAEPARIINYDEVVNFRYNPDLVESLIWTNNDYAQNGSVIYSILNLEKHGLNIDALWLGGHRPVENIYALRAGGRFVQFHNPLKYRFAFILPDRYFLAERDIIDLP